MTASSQGQVGVVEHLLSHGASVSVANSDGFTALLEGCTAGHQAVALLLLESGALISQSANDGTTPLMTASMHGHVEVVSSLLSHRADTSQAKANGFTALQAASGNGQAVVAEMLINSGASVATEGSTALISACVNRHVDVVRVLLDHGVSPCGEDELPLLQACVASHREVAALLISRKANVDNMMESARRQNLLSGVRRTLQRVDLPAVTKAVDSRDLDHLVREIEGPEQASTARPTVERRPKRGCVATVPSRTHELHEDIKDQEKDDEHVPSDGAFQQFVPHWSGISFPSGLGRERSRGSALDPEEENQPRWSSGLKGRSEAQAGAWQVHRLSRIGTAGTFYTVEVLGLEGRSSGAGREPVRSGPYAESSGPIGRDPLRSGPNAEVLLSRCRGWPSAEVSLIPQNFEEIADADRLVEGGISRVSCDCQGGSSGTTSPPESVPDRDALEEYAAWCCEVQQRCREASQRKPPGQFVQST